MPAHRVLALSFAFPPMPYPRAIQVPRLLAGLDASIVLLRGTEVGARTATVRSITDTLIAVMAHFQAWSADQKRRIEWWGKQG